MALTGAIRSVCHDRPVNQVDHIVKWLKGYADAKEELVSRMKLIASKYTQRDDAIQTKIADEKSFEAKMHKLESECARLLALASTLLSGLDRTSSIEPVWVLLCEEIKSIVPFAQSVYVGKVVMEGESKHVEYLTATEAAIVGRRLEEGRGVTWRLFEGEKQFEYIRNVVLDPAVEYLVSYPRIGSLYLGKFSVGDTQYVMAVDTVGSGRVGLEPRIAESLNACLSELGHLLNNLPEPKPAEALTEKCEVLDQDVVQTTAHEVVVTTDAPAVVETQTSASSQVQEALVSEDPAVVPDPQTEAQAVPEAPIAQADVSAPAPDMSAPAPDVSAPAPDMSAPIAT